MRQLRKLLVTFVTTLAIMAGAIAGAAPAHAAIGTTYNAWWVQRNVDSNRVLHLTPGQDSYITVTASVASARLTSLSINDVLDIRLEVSGGTVREMYSSLSYTTADPTHSAGSIRDTTTIKIDETISAYSVEFTGQLTPGATGDVTLTPVLYINDVRSTNSFATDFKSTNADWRAYAQTTYEGATYTVNENDYLVQARTTICADLGAVTAGQALTSTGTLKLDSATTGILVNTTYSQDGTSTSTTIVNPKPTKHLAAMLNMQYNYVSGDAGKVLSWSNDRAIKAAGTDVSGSCFSQGSTENTSGLNIWLTNMDNYVNQQWGQYPVTLLCDIFDHATGHRVTPSRNVMYMSNSQACTPESVQVGKTYDVTFKVYVANGLMLIDSWSRTWTPTQPADAMPPVLTGTAADSAKYESVDNITSATELGTLGAVVGEDGNAGQLVVTRQNDTTLRLSHWGPTSSIAIGTGSYIDFTDPRSDKYRTGEPAFFRLSRTKISWYGNFDKWIYSASDAEKFEFVTGTTTSNTTSHTTLTLDALNEACIAKLGAGASSNFYAGYGGDRTFDLIGAQTAKPLFTTQCIKPVVTGTASFTSAARTYLFELNINGATSTANVLTEYNSIGEVNTANPTVYGEPNTFICAYTSIAHSRKSNPSGTDPVLAIVALDADQVSNASCNIHEDPADVSKIESTVILANGTVQRNTSAAAISGKFADSVARASLAFDGLGNLKMLLMSTSNPSGTARDYTLYDVPTSGTDSGKFITPKALTLDTRSGFTGTNPNASGIVLANGSGNADALYAMRVELGVATAGATINLTTGAITTGEPLLFAGSSWSYMAGYYALQSANVDGEVGGGVNYYTRTTQTKYSVIHWLPGIDPSLGPVVSSNNSFTVTAGTTAVGTLTSTAGTASWAITGGANSSLFNINATTGALTFKTAATPGTYTVEVTVTDTANGNKTATQTITIVVPDVTAPTVTVNQTPTVSTTSTTVVTPSANESVTWSITGGAQQNDFNINSSTGAVTFKNAMPAGTYIVEITATDASGNTTAKTITVTVADGPDTTAPGVTVPDLTPEVNPGDTTVETLTANEPVTWSITSGADKNKFQINSSTGALEFKDPAEPGTYTVVVTATDASGNKTNKTITVTVPNAPVAPTITIPSPLNVLEFSTGDFSLLTSNQEVDWEIVTTSGINVTIVNGQLHFDGTFWNEHDGQTITVRATNPDTGLVTTKVITLNVVPVTVSASGSVNSSGNGSYTISTSNPLLDENDMVLDNVDNPNVTNVAYVNGVLTFDVDPNYTGTAVFTFCAAPGEGCLSYKTITLHLGAVSAPASATRYVVSPTKTTITWSAATNAARYVVKLNGKVICRTSGTICNYKGLIGPKQRVTVTAYGNNGSTAVITVKQSKSRFGLVGRVTNFAINSANLDWKKKYQLMVLARKLKAAGFTTIRIVGNTDDIGSLLVDMGLSKARANAVKLHLAFYLKGVKFVIEAKGRTNPIRSNTNGDNRKYNRRVDIYAA